MRIRFLSAATSVALAIALVSVFGTAAGASRPVAPTAAHKGMAHVFVTPSAHRTLYDQNDQSNGFAIVSEKFGEKAFGGVFDAQGADDFTVPAGSQWTVKEIDITGEYFNGAGPATSENVRFYESAAGRPGALIHKYIRIVGADDGLGSFIIDLGRGTKLAAGHYWVSVQVNMRFDTGGEWGWMSRDAQHRKPSMWQNPGDGFGTGCTSYRATTKCIPAGEGPDFMFALKGKKA